MPISIINIRV